MKQHTPMQYIKSDIFTVNSMDNDMYKLIYSQV